ncbi:MAG: orotidine-5'-phosphate decarboxylase [bacterium]
MSIEFIDRLYLAVQQRGTPLCVGFDPHVAMLPPNLVAKHMAQSSDPWSGLAAAVETFLLKILDCIAPHVPVIKPQLAFFEQFGPPGLAVLQRIVAEAHAHGLIVIADAKRGDIGSTAEAYAKVFFENASPDTSSIPPPIPSDAVTLNPYLGADAIDPFLHKAAHHGVFILVKTSNPSGGDIQNLPVGNGTVARKVAEWVHTLGLSRVGDCGWSSVGAVVGANHPAEALVLREIMPRTPFLIPGFGAQGADASDAVVALEADGFGGVINSSRDILFAYRKAPWQKTYGEDNYGKAAEVACLDAIDKIRKALKKKN